MSVYTEFVQMAMEMIDEFGVDCELVIPGTATPEDRPWAASSDATKDVKRKIRLFFSNPKEKTIAGSIVASGEKKAISAPLNPPLVPEEIVAVAYILKGKNKEKWKITAMELLNPADEEVLYTFKVGR